MQTEQEVYQFYEDLLRVISNSNEVVLKSNGVEKTYKDLLSNCYKYVQKLKTFSQRKIVVSAEKSFENYSLIIAILITNNIWVPISTDTPVERMRNIVKICRPHMVFYDHKVGEDFKLAISNCGVETIFLEEIKSSKGVHKIELPTRSPSDLSMVYFTSGSTGIPKGVKIKQESFVRNVNNIIQIIQFPANPVIADLHELSFVISIPVIFPCLFLEGTLVPLIDLNDKLRLATFVQRNSVNVLLTVPSTFEMIRKEGLNKIMRDQLHTIILCGEPCYIDTLDMIYNNLDTKHIYNFYGSTEVAPWIFFHKCDKEDIKRFAKFKHLPIGKPIKGNSIMIRDDELLVSGVQVTPGYLNNMDKEKFLNFGDMTWFKTGDRVNQIEGVYFCKGRTDNLVKIAGKRIDLSEIEVALRSIKKIKNAVCFTNCENRPEYIIAFLDLEEEAIIEPDSLRKILSSSLPNYMIPRRFILSTNPPLNRSGKIDRALIKLEYRN